jgi:hypothetical protein
MDLPTCYRDSFTFYGATSKETELWETQLETVVHKGGMKHVNNRGIPEFACKGREEPRKTSTSSQIQSVFLVSCGGASLSPLGTLASIWPIVPARDDRWWWVWSSRWNENWQGKPKYSEKTCSNATLSTTNPTWSELTAWAMARPCPRTQVGSVTEWPNMIGWGAKHCGFHTCYNLRISNDGSFKNNQVNIEDEMRVVLKLHASKTWGGSENKARFIVDFSTKGR